MEDKQDKIPTRTEHDSIGTKEVPEDVYYGVQTLRAAEITAMILLNRAQAQLERLYQELNKKAEEFNRVIKMGRTQLQDAVSHCMITFIGNC